jgi:hypothetical protein
MTIASGWRRIAKLTSAEMWLHVLRYTPHHKILLDAEQIMNKHGGLLQYHQKLLSGGLDPNDIHHHAVAYDTQGNEAYLGIWEAADGEEFVLGHNSFGLWEGLFEGRPSIHRLFVVSPRVMIVLRNICLRPDHFPDGLPAQLLDAIHSHLFDISMPTAIPEYCDKRFVSTLSSNEDWNRYRTTKLALDDVFNSI